MAFSFVAEFGAADRGSTEVFLAALKTSDPPANSHISNMFHTQIPLHGGFLWD